MAKPLLTLTTLTEYPTVEIDGVPYALRPADALPASSYQALQTQGDRFDALWKVPQRTAEETTELETVLDAICRLMLQAPVDVHDKLTDVQRLRICQAFLELPHEGLQSMRQPAILKPTTGARSPHGSNASTAATTRRRGSPGSRSRSSAPSSR